MLFNSTLMSQEKLDEKSQKYYNLALLLEQTTKIESTLETLRGIGNGMYAKSEHLFNDLDDSFKLKIIALAEIRNLSVHGSPKIDDLEDALKKSNEIIFILEDYKIYLECRATINLKFKECHQTRNEISSLDEETSSWINSLFNKCILCGTDKFKKFISKQDYIISVLNKYSISYYQKRWNKITIIAFAISIAIFLLYFLLKGKL